MKIIVFLIKFTAAVLLISGAFVATQSKIGAAEILLICVAMSVIADIMRGIGESFGQNSKEEPVLPGPDKLQK